MMEGVFALIGATIGGAIIWFYRRSREAVLETRLEESEKRFAEQQRLLADAQAKLETAFKAMAGEALKSNNQAFLQLAEQTLKGYLSEADDRKKAVEDLVKPLNDALKQYQEKADKMEIERATAYGGVSSLLQELKQETGALSSALRSPNVRGQWGELTLKRVAELAGLVAHCDFEEQPTVNTEEGALRPDMVVHLPNRRDIVVDSKAVLTAYLEAQDAKTEEARAAAIQKHVQNLKDRVKALSSKKYWSEFKQSPEFVVLFVPGEAFLAAALQKDHELVEDALNRNVVIATPTTLVALLKAVAHGWREEQMAQNAQQVSQLGKQLFDSVSVWAGHLKTLREAIDATVKSFNNALGSWDTNVFHKARKMKELGVTSDKEIPVIDAVDKRPIESTKSETAP